MEQNEQYSVIVLQSAKDDLLGIISYFTALGSKKGAQRIRLKFSKGVEQLRFFPYSAPVIPDPSLDKLGFRMLFIENYLILHKVFDDEKKVLIYRVIDGRQNYYTTLKAYTE